MSRRLGLLIMLTMLVVLVFASPAGAEELQLSAQGALLMDGVSGEILYEQNPEAHCYPASVTKLMTLVLTLEAVDSGKIDLDDLVTTSEDAAGMGGSQVYLYPGETRTVDEMLIAIAVGSGNDAAYAMAEFVGGSYSSFVEMMNQRAQELGMVNTHFTNPHGLHHENHYTSAADLGKLAYYAIQVPRLLDYTSIYEYEFRPEPKLLTLWNTNRLLKWYDGVDGLKTGYTEEGGRSIVTTAQRDGMRLVAVILSVAERNGHFTEAMNLLNYGFNNFQYYPLYSEQEIIAQITVSKGQQDAVDVMLNQAVGYTGIKNESAEISTQIELLPGITAPVEQGVVVGSLTVLKDGATLLQVELITADAVEKGGLMRTWQKLLNLMGLGKSSTLS